MKKSIKTTIMTVLFFAVSTAYGLYESMKDSTMASSVMWTVIGITTGVSLVVYLVQSFWIPSTSAAGELNILDWVKGAIVALGPVAGTIISANVTDTSINWAGMAAAIATVFGSYIFKQFKTNPTGTPPSK